MKIVVVRQLGGIGDNIIQSCVFRGLKEKYTNSHITVITDAVYQAGSLKMVVDRNPFIDKVVPISPAEFTTRETMESWPGYYPGTRFLEEELLIKKADLAIDLNSPCAQYESQCLADKLPITKPRYEIWCERAGVTPSTYFPVYEFKAGEEEKGKEYFQRFVEKAEGKPIAALGLNAVDPRRGLVEKELYDIAMCLRMRGFYVVTVDATKTFEGFDYMIGLPVFELMAVLKNFNVMVTVDSGLLHMAGALEVPLVGIFGPTDPDMRMKLYKGVATYGSTLVPCSPCWYLYGCMDTKLKKQI